jgi:hypothetical protein
MTVDKLTDQDKKNLQLTFNRDTPFDGGVAYTYALNSNPDVFYPVNYDASFSQHANNFKNEAAHDFEASKGWGGMKGKSVGLGGAYKGSVGIYSLSIRPEIFSNSEEHVGFNLELDYNKTESIGTKPGSILSTWWDWRPKTEISAYAFTKDVPLNDGYFASKKSTYSEGSITLKGYRGFNFKVEGNSQGTKRAGVTTGDVGVRFGNVENKKARFTGSFF